MKHGEMLKVIKEVNESHEVDLDVSEVLDYELMDETVLRGLAVKAANHLRQIEGKEPLNVEPEAGATEQQEVDISNITDPNELFKIGMAQRAKDEARAEEKRQKRARREKILAEVMAERKKGK